MLPVRGSIKGREEMCMCVCVSVCVCERERERERQREREREKEREREGEREREIFLYQRMPANKCTGKNRFRKLSSCSPAYNN